MYAKQAQYNACLVLPAGKVGLRREIDRGKSTEVHVHDMRRSGGVIPHVLNLSTKWR
jgi:hypothetical protein